MKAIREGNVDVAVIGFAGRFPGARTVEEYWANLRNGVESFTWFSEAELIEAGLDPAVVRHPDYVKAGPVLAEADCFDAAFFGYAPREAETIDPQHRVFLECAWEALEHAGYDAGRCAGAIGVYAGAAMNTYLLFSGLLPRLADDYLLTLTGSDKDFLATRVSYKMNLKGPSLTVQTACSTSLVAVHLACQSLLSRESDMALAGGVSVRVPLKAGYLFQPGSLFSPDGHCRAFDAKAQGTVFGSGVGVVVLKRLSEATADRDTIHAVIKGSAVNNDGAAKVSYMAPSVERQAAVIAEALAAADVDADTISYVEAHGTGTELGDPIEVAALTRAFRMSTDRRGYCALGSVKTNIGHLDAAAGVAGLIKTILTLKDRSIPPSLHCDQPNPAIDFADSPFYVNRALRDWPAAAHPRRAGISALGGGGTNAHVILEEAPTRQASCHSRPSQLLLISARTPAGLEASTTNLVRVLARTECADLPDVAYTLAVGRRPFPHRRAIVSRDGREAALALSTADPRRVFTSHCRSVSREIVFMFPGQGAQHVNMGLGLYKSDVRFREQVDRCAAMLQSRLSIDLRSVLYPEKQSLADAAQKLNTTAFAQAALFTVEYALAKLWMSVGLRPTAFIGHSVGELVAACLAGVFSLEDALWLVGSRGQMMEEQERGSMMAVSLPLAETESLLDAHVSVAAINTGALCTVSGKTASINALKSRLEQRGVNCRVLATSHAFHSAMMEPIAPGLTALVADIARKPPQIPFISNVTGTWITAEQATDPEYWGQHARHCVRFTDGLNEVLATPNRLLLEVGPGQTLTSFSAQHPAKSEEHIVLSSLPQPASVDSEIDGFLTTLGRLWLSGTEIDWVAFSAHEQRRRLPLPTYPFERKRFWPASGRRTQPIVNGMRSGESGDERPGPACTAPGPATINPGHAVRPMVPRRNGGSPSPVETVIAGIWREVLELPHVGIHDNFYELGGHSILIAQVISRVNRAFELDFSPLVLVESPTVAALAACVEDVYHLERSAVARSDRGSL